MQVKIFSLESDINIQINTTRGHFFKTWFSSIFGHTSITKITWEFNASCIWTLHHPCRPAASKSCYDAAETWQNDGWLLRHLMWDDCFKEWARQYAVDYQNMLLYILFIICLGCQSSRSATHTKQCTEWMMQRQVQAFSSGFLILFSPKIGAQSRRISKIFIATGLICISQGSCPGRHARAWGFVLHNHHQTLENSAKTGRLISWVNPGTHFFLKQLFCTNGSFFKRTPFDSLSCEAKPLVLPTWWSGGGRGGSREVLSRGHESGRFFGGQCIAVVSKWIKDCLLFWIGKKKISVEKSVELGSAATGAWEDEILGQGRLSAQSVEDWCLEWDVIYLVGLVMLVCLSLPQPEATGCSDVSLLQPGRGWNWLEYFNMFPLIGYNLFQCSCLQLMKEEGAFFHTAYLLGPVSHTAFLRPANLPIGKSMSWGAEAGSILSKYRKTHLGKEEAFQIADSYYVTMFFQINSNHTFKLQL